MRILNVHDRTFAVGPDDLGPLIDDLASDRERLWPRGEWPALRLSNGLRVGSAGGHGPIRYFVEAFEPGRRVVFRFTRPEGWSGTHEFGVRPDGGGGTSLRHVLEMEAKGWSLILWAVVFRPLHDALIEDALARAAAALGQADARPPRHSLYVRLLRRLLRPGGRRGKRESMRSRVARWRFNLFPAYRRTGARITFIAADWSEVRIRLPLDRRTRNYVGTMFGGSMYAAVDPVYMVMLIQRLGRDFVVWDRSAAIWFRRPGRDTLFCSFSLTDAEIDEIRAALQRDASVDRAYQAQLVDRLGQVHAVVDKTIHIRRRA